MVIVNFSHPLVPDQLAEIERIAGQPVARVIEVKAQFDPAALLKGQRGKR